MWTIRWSRKHLQSVLEKAGCSPPALLRRHMERIVAVAIHIQSCCASLHSHQQCIKQNLKQNIYLYGVGTFVSWHTEGSFQELLLSCCHTGSRGWVHAIRPGHRCLHSLNYLRGLLKIFDEGWRDGLMLKSSCCSFRGRWFNSQIQKIWHPLLAFVGTACMWCRDMHSGTNTYIK